MIADALVRLDDPHSAKRVAHACYRALAAMPMKNQQGSPLWGPGDRPPRWKIPALVVGGMVMWAVVFGIGYLLARAVRGRFLTVVLM